MRKNFNPAFYFNLTCILALLLLAGCSAAPANSQADGEDTGGLSADVVATLNSLEKLDDYPLYLMHYVGAYDPVSVSSSLGSGPVKFGCSLFAALGDPANRLYGRNFDWGGTPALLLFTDPPDGYASVSMVSLTYVTLDVTAARHPDDLSLQDRQFLLSAPLAPIDGMNEYGLAIGMAAVEGSTAGNDPSRPTIGSLRVMREILDHARTIEEAVAIMSSYNIDFSGGPAIHYLIADQAGQSVVVEYYQGEMITLPGEGTWNGATNHLRCRTTGDGGCSRLRLISERLTETGGRLDPTGAMELLSQVSQQHTDWSIVYGISTGGIRLSVGRSYETIYDFSLELAIQ